MLRESLIVKQHVDLAIENHFKCVERWRLVSFGIWSLKGDRHLQLVDHTRAPREA